MITKSDIENLVELLDRVTVTEGATEAWSLYTKEAKMALAENILDATITELRDEFSCGGPLQ